ncbi:hypothetical protein RZ59_03555 [[Haemophilus] ducreyi]|nr:Abi family protein [[Haemophilus] ducreyi]AKO35174.1 hypothetical protein RZ59_03555 [[Haemophilus] ducreyi]
MLKDRGYFNNHCEPNELNKKAYDMYLWNIQISSAFLEVISLYEVTLRNTLVKALEPNYRQYSILNDNFIRALRHETREALIVAVNKVSLNSHKYSAVRGAHGMIQPLKIDPRDVPVGKVVAELNFVFWENMLSKTHSSRWKAHYKEAFPNLVVEPNIGIECQIARIHQITGKVRELRNRICHHEPIFDENKINLSELYTW